MGRKGNWFSSVKKALSPDSKQKKSKKANKLHDEQQDLPPNPVSLPEGVKSIEVEIDQSKHDPSSAATDSSAAQATTNVVKITTASQFPSKTKEEMAATKIQTAFRGYTARRALRALRGLVRLKSLVQGPAVKRQAINTLRSMQILTRVQAQIRSRRMRMLEENQALQRQFLQKHDRETLGMGEEWDDSLQSKEKIEANLLSKHEAALRRERAMAYAYSHQQNWKKSIKSSNPFSVDPSNPTWGWSWLERWTTVCPWEGQTFPDNELSSVKSVSRSIAGSEITKAYVRHHGQSPKTPPSLSKLSPGVSAWAQDGDSKSTVSLPSARHRRHSTGGSSVRDDESVASSAALPSYMTPTHSAKAKLRQPSPLGAGKNGASDKGSVSSAKKRLSYPAASPARPRRHSGPPKVGSSLIAQNEGNGTESQQLLEN